MRKGIVLGSVLIAALMMSAVACGGGGSANPTPTKASTQPTATPTGAAGATPTGEVVTVQQTENPYRFIPDTYNFQVGKTYTLVFEKAKEFHTFSVKDLTIQEAANVDIFINAGETVQQNITPTKAGTFKLFCVPHEGLGMVGQVIVQ